jgi:hypothetical protein
LKEPKRQAVTKGLPRRRELEMVGVGSEPKESQQPAISRNLNPRKNTYVAPAARYVSLAGRVSSPQPLRADGLRDFRPLRRPGILHGLTDWSTGNPPEVLEQC